MNKNIVIVSLVVLAVGGGAFFAGMKYGENQNASASPFSKNFQGMPNGGQIQNGTRVAGNISRGGSGVASGEIIAVDSDSVTIKAANGSSKIVFFSDQTKIGNFVDAASSDLAEGKNVMVMGMANSDGSIIANNIQIGAQTFRFAPPEANPLDKSAEEIK